MSLNSKISSDKIKGNIKEFDILRGFAIIFVVIIHTFGLVYHYKEGIEYLLTYGIIFIIAQSAVPIFLFISGYFLRLKYINQNSLKSIFKSRVKKIVLPYLLFSIIYLLYNNWRFDLNTSFLEGIYQILTFSVEFHFWFLGLLVFFYIFFPLLNKCFEEFNKFKLLIGSVILQLIWIVLEITIYKQFLSNPNMQILIFFIKYAFISYNFYFILGMYFAENYDQVIDKSNNKKGVFILILFLIPSILLYYFYMDLVYFKLTTMPLSILEILIFYKISLNLKEKKIGNLFEFFGRYSYGIYLIHPLITSLLGYIFEIGALFYLLLFVNVCFFSLSIIYLINLLPYSEILIGKVRD
ncbi:MAG: acyltransferase [Candidatus Hermodarchaeota archaeon]